MTTNCEAESAIVKAHRKANAAMYLGFFKVFGAVPRAKSKGHRGSPAVH